MGFCFFYNAVLARYIKRNLKNSRTISYFCLVTIAQFFFTLSLERKNSIKSPLEILMNPGWIGKIAHKTIWKFTGLPWKPPRYLENWQVWNQITNCQTGADPEFSVEGDNNPLGGVNISFWNFLKRKLHEVEKILIRDPLKGPPMTGFNVHKGLPGTPMTGFHILECHKIVIRKKMVWRHLHGLHSHHNFSQTEKMYELWKSRTVLC